MEEVSAPVIGIAVILAAVFVPTVFVPGITGRLYQQFAITIAISVVISAFNALTLSPALSALLLRPAKPRRRGPCGAHHAGQPSVEQQARQQCDDDRQERFELPIDANCFHFKILHRPEG